MDPLYTLIAGLGNPGKGGIYVQEEQRNLHDIENVNFYSILFKLLE
jgi:hypothetical protein